jgi:hypothetical protein
MRTTLLICATIASSYYGGIVSAFFVATVKSLL